MTEPPSLEPQRAGTVEGAAKPADAVALVPETTLSLMWRKFRRHKLAQAGGILLGILIIGVVFAPFFSPYSPERGNLRHSYTPPQRIRFFGEDGTFHLRPFTYSMVRTMDPTTLQWTYAPDTTQRYALRFWVRGWEYRVLGLFRTDLHLFGVEAGGTVYLLGTDVQGRDMFGRILFGGRYSLLIAALGAGLGGVLGAIVGTVSGYFSGTTDLVIQRLIEVLLCFPALPLWMTLSAALPRDWDPTNTVYAIAVIFSALTWPGIARQVRAKVLSYRESDFVLAAKAVGAGSSRIMFRHVLPQALSHIIVATTVAMPGLMIGESTLSFLGLGVQPPMASWGTLMQRASQLQVLGQYPWIMIPGVFLVLTILCMSFLGDGLRDAADPYSRR